MYNFAGKPRAIYMIQQSMICQFIKIASSICFNESYALVQTAAYEDGYFLWQGNSKEVVTAHVQFVTFSI